MKAAALILSTVVALVACSDAFSPPPGLPFSRITYICSITGIGEHTTITLRRSATVPYLIVSFEQRQPSQVHNGTWVVPSDSVSAFYYAAPDQAESGSGTITIKRAAPEFPVLGELDLQFGSQPIRGEFRALWEEPPVC